MKQSTSANEGHPKAMSSI